jgi:hypothetical protein
METRYSLILMSALGCSSFVWGEKALKIRETAADRPISKLISESREHSKHCPMFQFETLFRLPALLHQWHSMSSLKFFSWNFATGDVSSINWAKIENEQEYNLLFRCRPSLRGHTGGTGRNSTLAMSSGYSGKNFRKDAGWVWTRSFQNGFVKRSRLRNQCCPLFQFEWFRDCGSSAIRDGLTA